MALPVRALELGSSAPVATVLSGEPHSRRVSCETLPARHEHYINSCLGRLGWQSGLLYSSESSGRMQAGSQALRTGKDADGE